MFFCLIVWFLVPYYYFSLVHDFTAIPSIISHALIHNMKCNPPDHPVLMTEAPWNNAENRKRMAEIMFEEFKVPAFYISNTAVLSSSVCPSPCKKIRADFSCQDLRQEKGHLWL
jgi:hypothetical protein